MRIGRPSGKSHHAESEEHGDGADLEQVGQQAGRRPLEHHRAGGKERGVERSGVIRLALKEDEDGKGRHTGPAQAPERPQRRGGDQAVETGGREEHRGSAVELSREEPQRADPVELTLPQVGHLPDDRKAEPDLTDDAGCADQQCRGQSDPGPRREQRGAEWRRQQCDHDRDPDEHDAELRQQPESERQSQQHPASRPVSAHQSEEGVERRRPDELVHHHGLQQVGRAHEERAGHDAERGQRLGHPAPAQLARDEGRQDEDRAPEERREEPDGRERVAHESTGDLRHDRDRGRKIHLPEAQVPAHAEIQQLVPVKSIGRAQVDEDVQADLDHGLQEDQAGRKGRPRGQIAPGGGLCGHAGLRQWLEGKAASMQRIRAVAPLMSAARRRACRPPP